MTTPQIPWSGYFLILNQDGKLMDLSGITLPTGDELMIYDDVNGDDLVVKRRADDGTETELRFRGGIQPKIYTRRSALSADATFSVADFNAGLSSQNDVVPVGGGAVDRYLAFWQPATELELTIIREVDVKGNERAEFGDPTPLTVGGVAGYFWASIAMIAAARFGKNWIVDTEGATQKVFPRLVGWSDDDVIDVTDFMSTETVTGYGNIIRIPAHADQGAWAWAAVPEGEEPFQIRYLQAFGGMIAQASVVYDGTTWATYRTNSEQNAALVGNGTFDMWFRY